MRTLIQTEGILNIILPEFFKQPHVRRTLLRHRDASVAMLVTTQTGAIKQHLAREQNFYRPSRVGEPLQYSWKANGKLQDVSRRFRLDFLRHLGEEGLTAYVYLGIYIDVDESPVAPPESFLEPGAARETTPRDQSAAAPAQPAPPDARRATGAPGQRLRPATESGAMPLGDWSPALPVPADEPDRTAAAAGGGEQFWSTARVIDALAPGEPTESGPEAIEDEPTAQARGSEPPPAPPAEPQPQAARAAPSPLPGNLYQDFFGFECMPFNNTPDTHFYFPSEKHQEALSRLIYAIAERKGFVMISGEIGSGKSTLCRALLGQLPSEVRTAVITHTYLDASQLIRAIAEDFELNTRGLIDYDVLQRLNHYLIEQLQAGRTVIIIIDEAQNLSPEALEAVRLISNLETEREKLIQLILLGQPELRDKLKLPQLRQLRQRISVQYHLEPLNRGETLAYIAHRLRVARPIQKLGFSRRTMREVFRFSGGVPRLINTLCDNALLTAYTRDTRAVTPGMIREAAADLELEPQAMGLADFFRLW